MKRASGVAICTMLLSCRVVRAQEGPDLAALEQTAQKRGLEWEALAKDMNDRMARMLPCDPRATAAVNEVSRASDARLESLSNYLKAVAAKAFAETADARNLLTIEERSAVEVSLERADASQEQTAVDTQSDALAQSVRQRASLEAPQKVLAQIAAMIHQRSAATEQRATSADSAIPLLRDLVAKSEARDAALREEFAASEAERSRWSGYYAARLARAQIECSITQIGTPAPKGRQGKR
jgi:hypothetical protein